MNRKKILVSAIVVVLVLGLGIGLAVGVKITNSKRKAEIAALQSKMQQAEAESKKKSSDYESALNRSNGQLRMAAAEIQKLRSLVLAAEKAAAEEKEQAAVVPEAAPVQADTDLYIVKAGDSPWKIAATQLGDGERYKEILKLNPDISPDGKNLTVGMKLKLPRR
jgi:nucleoid-associated protein YgaU